MKTFPKPLTASEEREYLLRLQSGDREAKDILIERNMRLVAHVVKKYQYTDHDMEDLISVGTIGLIKAVNTFHPDRGSKLATYAAKCVENAILSQMRFWVYKRIPLVKSVLAGVYSHSFQRTITSCVGLKMAWFGIHHSAYTHLG